MSGIQFSERVLQSHRKFEQYLANQDAIDRIREEADRPYVPEKGKLGTLEVTWVAATTPFRIYYSIFLEATGAFLYYVLSMRETAIDLYVMARRQETYTCMVLENYLFTSYRQVLVDVLNTVSYDAREVYTHERINLEKVIRDESVLAHLHPTYIDERNHLIFDTLGGQCSGICDWMAYLYFKTEEDFIDPEHHLAAVVKEVSDGAGREAALWQLAQIDQPPILGLKKRCVAQLNSPTVDKTRELLEGLRIGLYSVGTKTHRMNLAVVGRETYLIEPNRGLVKDTPENIARSLAKNSVLKVCEISV